MNRRIAVAIAALSVVYLGLAASPAANGADAKSGSIKGEVTVSGVRSPENVVVYIVEAPGEHKPPKKPVEIDQKKLTFIPHVSPIVVGTTVVFKNGDPLLHNIFWPAASDGSYAGNNLGTWGQGDSRSFTFNKLGSVILLCNIHAEMEGHILVLQNPYFAVVGKDGAYEIKNVPPGKYTLKTWYERPKKLRSKTAEVTVAAGETATQDFSLSRHH